MTKIFEPKTWYGIAWIKDIVWDKYYRVQVCRYGGSSRGSVPIFEIKCISGYEFKKLNEGYFEKEYTGAGIHIQFQELDTEKIKELL